MAVSFACERMTDYGWNRSPARFRDRSQAVAYVSAFMMTAGLGRDWRVVETDDAPNSCLDAIGRLCDLDGEPRIATFKPDS